jgi:hypothetical protein
LTPPNTRIDIEEIGRLAASFRQRLPIGVLAGTVAELAFTLDKAAEPSPDDRRELGLVVSFARPGHAVADVNLPVELE